MVDTIITDIEKLSERSDEFIEIGKENKEIQQLNLRLKKVIDENNLLALSAPQIGIFKRMIVINFDGKKRALINPMIVKATGLSLSKETCSSVPNKQYIRFRNNKITINYIDPLGKICGLELVGKAAFVVQHHIDHLDGLLLPHVGLEIDEDFNKASDEEKQQILQMYAESLDVAKANVEKQIEEDPDAKKLSEAVTFMEKVQKGEIELEKCPKKTEVKQNGVSDTN